MLKIKKLNTKGFAHHLLIPVLVIFVIAGMGTYVLQRSRASVAYANGLIYTGNSFVKPDGSNEQTTQYLPSDLAPEGWYDNISYSPDGSKIAYTVTISYDEQRKRKSLIKTADSNGANAKVVYSPPDSELQQDNNILFKKPSWSSDGKYLSFIQNSSDNTVVDSGSGKLIVVRSDGTQNAEDSYSVLPMFPQRVTDSPTAWFSQSGAQFVPNSYKVGYIISRYYAEGDDVAAELCTAELSSNSEPQCKPINGINSSMGPYPSDLRISNSGVVLFTTSFGRPLPDMTDDVQIYKLDMATAHATTFGKSRAGSQFSGTPRNIEWSPDGKLIAYQEGQQRLPEHESLMGTYIIDAITAETKKISDHAFMLAWQPYPVGGQPSAIPSSPLLVSCSIKLPGAGFKANALNQPVAIFKSNSMGAISEKYRGSYDLVSSNQLTHTNFAEQLLKMTPGQELSINLPAIMIPTAKHSGDKLGVNVEYMYPQYGNCMEWLPLPLPTVSLTNPLSQTVRYGASLSVTGKTSVPDLPLMLTYSTGLNTPGNSDSRGNFLISSVLPKQDVTFQVKETNTSAVSSTHSVKLYPNVSGALTRTVRKGSTAVVSGTYRPNTSLTINMRRPTDPAGTYPLNATVKTDASGNFRYTYIARTKRVLYVVGPNGAKSPNYVYGIR